MKKNGFFSMSLVYSFFLVFALITAVLLANYAHNRLLVKNYNVEIKEDLTLRADNKLAYLKNLLYNPSFEYNEYTGYDEKTDEISDEHRYYNWDYDGTSLIDPDLNNISGQSADGQYSVLFNRNFDGEPEDQAISQTLRSGSVKPGHVYYLQWKIYTNFKKYRYNNIEIYLHNTNTDAKYYFAYKNPEATFRADNWQIMGSFCTIDKSIAPEDEGSEDWEFVYYQKVPSRVGEKNSYYDIMYLDTFVLVDLTDAYNFIPEDINMGAEGYEVGRPYFGQVYNMSLMNWLNGNIKYFEHKYIHNKKDYDLFKYSDRKEARKPKTSSDDDDDDD